MQKFLENSSTTIWIILTADETIGKQTKAKHNLIHKVNNSNDKQYTLQ